MNECRPYLRVPLKTAEQAVEFIKKLHSDNALFHFEDPPEDVVTCNFGARLFSDIECGLVRSRVKELFSLLRCPFEEAIKIIGAN